jgi:hypothetical protein
LWKTSTGFFTPLRDERPDICFNYQNWLTMHRGLPPG